MKLSEDEQFDSTTKYKFVELPISYALDFKARLGESKEFRHFDGIGRGVSY
jgi:hypothetical protein